MSQFYIEDYYSEIIPQFVNNLVTSASLKQSVYTQSCYGPVAN